MKHLICFAFFLFFSIDLVGQSKSIEHILFDQFLKKYVDERGNVNYVAITKNKKELEIYLDLLRKNPPNDLWTKNEKLAYWINAYNAFTISIVVDHYPVAGIKEIKPGLPFINSVWDIKFIKIGNEIYDLNNIEHGILRKKFEEPRIHFAINCASYSCPKLNNEAYIASKLDAQLTAAAKSFLADPTKNEIKSNEIKLSKIFAWYGGDFKKKTNLITYLNLYSPIKISPKPKISYKEYDWSLNKQ